MRDNSWLVDATLDDVPAGFREIQEGHKEADKSVGSGGGAGGEEWGTRSRKWREDVVLVDVG